MAGDVAQRLREIGDAVMKPADDDRAVVGFACRNGARQVDGVGIVAGGAAIGRASGLGDVETDRSDAVESLLQRQRIVTAATGEIGDLRIAEINAVEQPAIDEARPVRHRRRIVVMRLIGIVDRRIVLLLPRTIHIHPGSNASRSETVGRTLRGASE